MEMTITLTEMFLGAWAAVMTLLWISSNTNKSTQMRKMTSLLHAVADKHVTLIRDENGGLAIRKGENYVDAR